MSFFLDVCPEVRETILIYSFGLLLLGIIYVAIHLYYKYSHQVMIYSLLTAELLPV